MTQRTANLDAQQLALAFDAPAFAVPAKPPDPPSPVDGARVRRILLGTEPLHYRLRRARRRFGFSCSSSAIGINVAYLSQRARGTSE